MTHRLVARAAEFAEDFAALLTTRRAREEDVTAAVRAIVAEVRARGDTALIEFAERFDKVSLTPATLRLSEREIASAQAECGQAALTALEVAARRIEDYHRRQLPLDADYTDEIGVRLGWRWTALESVGLYVPGGTAGYPSSVLMNAIPAKVAGVKCVVMATPASRGGINPLAVEAARRTGVSEIYRIGGAQAIAALAFGTETIAPVDKIVGPGNAYVAAAKREVFGQVGINSVAGPSEILIVADGAGNPEWIAADLLAQAEHDALAQSILITDDAGFADKVEEAVARALALLPRKEIASASWRDWGAIIVVANLSEAPLLIDKIAPEHLQIATSDPEALFERVSHAGAVFLGHYTPEAMGDYIAGPNHVLPTSRTARFSSGLSVLDFLKRTSILSCPPDAIAQLGPDAIALAECEGLDAHARSIAARLNLPEGR